MSDANQSTEFPRDKGELLRRIERERQALEQTISGLSEAQMTRPGPEGWSIKDHLAHIVVWEQVMLVAHLQGRSFAEAAEMDEATAEATRHMTAEGGLNDYFFERDKDKPLAEVLAAFHASYGRVMQTLEQVDFAWLTARQGGSSRSLLDDKVVGNTYEHYDEHRQWIEQILAAQSSKGNL